MVRKRELERRPIHPRAILREDTLPAIGMSQTEFAKVLGVSAKTIGELLKERSRLSVDLAQRIGLALGMSPEIWLRLQRAVDLYDWQLKNRVAYKRIERIAA